MSIEKTAVETKQIETNAEVFKLLRKAANASKTVYESVKSAAVLAAEQLDVNLPFKRRIEKVVNCYEDAWGDDKNIKSNFRDLLTCLAAESSPVSFEYLGNEVHTTGREAALDHAKNAMKSAAKAVRDDNEMGRASGAGRKRKSEKAENASTLSAAALDTGKAQRGAVINTVVQGLDDAAFFAELKAKLDAAGYTIRKKSK